MRAVVFWEIDKDALLVSEADGFQGKKFPRGDFTRDTPRAVAELLHQLDPDHQCAILAAAGPPCPDFSKIQPEAKGRLGESGSLFVSFTRFFRELEECMPKRKVRLLVENVCMNSSADVSWFSHSSKLSQC